VNNLVDGRGVAEPGRTLRNVGLAGWGVGQPLRKFDRLARLVVIGTYLRTFDEVR